MAADVAALERAAAELENPATRAAAEAALLAFRDAPTALDTARAVVDSPASLGARFQAALVLRDAGLRRWAELGLAGQAALRSYLVSALLASAARPGDGLVSSQLARALATLTKRAWGGWAPAERAAALAELEGAACGGGGGAAANPAAAAVALSALEALVAEFNPATASAAGLPWEYHDACRADMQAGALARIYGVAAAAAAGAAPAAVAEVRTGGPGPGPAAAVCGSALGLATTVLAWDFRPAGVPAASYGGGRPAVDAPTVRPPPSFAAVLLPGSPGDTASPASHAWLLQGLAPALSASADLGAARSRLAAAARGLVVALAGLDGDVFGGGRAGGGASTTTTTTTTTAAAPSPPPAATAHASRVLAPLLGWAHPPVEAAARADGPGGGDGGELRDAARAWAALAPVHRAAGLAAAPAPRPALAAMADLAAACLAAGGGVGDDALVGDAADAGGLLLDAWADALAPPASGPSPSSSAPPPLPPSAAEGAAAVFDALVRASLATAAAGALESEDEGEAAAAAGGAGGAGSAAEDALARAAALGRAAPDAGCALLADGLDGCRAALAAAAASGADPSVPLEQLCWLARAAAAFLADPADGEAPGPPPALAAAAAAAAAAGRPCPVARLSASLLALPGLALGGEGGASPRLMEAAAWAAGRWAGTHLAPEAAASPAMAAAYGPGPGGDGAVADLARVAGALLGGWAGEVDLHTAVAKRLLPALVRRKRAAAAALRAPAWAALAAAFAAGPDGPAGDLAEPVIRALGQTLASGAAGAPDADSARGYVGQLAAGPAAALARLGGGRGGGGGGGGGCGGGAAAPTPLSPAEAARPDVARRLAFLMEALRGVVRGAPPRTAPAVFAAFAGGAADALLGVQAAVRAGRRETTLLLKLAAALVDGLVCHLPPADAGRLIAWALAVARAHAAARAGEVSAAAAAALRDADAADAEREVRALVALTSALASRDVTDFSAGGAGGDGPVLDVGGAVYAALEAVAPLVGGGMLAFPKLARAYFGLLGHVLAAYPDHLPAAPPALASALLAALEHGCTASGDADVAKPSLEALAALARWAARDAAAGGAGGGAALAPHLGARLVRPLLASLLVGGDAASLAVPRSRVDAAADALLPLAMGAPGAWGEARSALLAGVGDPAAAARLGGCLTAFEAALTEAASALEAHGARAAGGAAAERAARRKFRGAANSFVEAARGIVRTR